MLRLNGWTTPHNPDFLRLVPQWALSHPWAYFTATFTEHNVATFLIAAVTVVFGGKYLERAWDSREFGKFVLLVTLLPNFVASLLYVLWFAISRDDEAACVETPPFLHSYLWANGSLAGQPSKAQSLWKRPFLSL